MMKKSVGHGSQYTDDQRRQAVVEYCVNGNMSKVSAITEIPETTLSYWKNKSDWWDEMAASVRSQIEETILSQNLQIAIRAGERVLDSLENGDEKLIWDKEKQEHVIKRVKPTGKDAAVISGISQDKARVQLNLPTSISDNRSSEQQLAENIKFFREIGRKYREEQINSIPGACEEISNEKDK